MEALLPLAQDICCLLSGLALRRLQFADDADANAAVKLVSWVTCPALVLQSLCAQGRWTSLSLVACGSGLLFNLASHVSSRMWFQRSHARQRAIFMGCSVGSSALLWSFPLAESLFGYIGLQSVILFNAANIFADHVLSYLSFASAGPAFPASYVHQDGSVYSGQWNGLNKEGVGSYKYKSGATYEGEWKANQKNGRGVYYFPAGGLYEGEWLDGNRNGIGIRTFSDGRMQVGRWAKNKLISPLDVWQCADAVSGATQAAKAARNVQIGGGRLTDALHRVLQQPVLWATAAAFVINLLNQDLSPTMHVITRTSAALHRPLALMATGLTFPTTWGDAKQMFASLLVVGNRLLIGLVLSCSVILGCYYRYPDYTPFALPLLLITQAPISLHAVQNAMDFRLNEGLMATISYCSSTLSALTMSSIAIAVAVIRPNVPHSRLPLALANTGFVASGVLLSILLILGLKFRPAVRKRLILTEHRTQDSSTLDHAALQDILKHADISKEEPPPQSSIDERRSPPAPQAVFWRPFPGRRRSSRVTPLHRRRISCSRQMSLFSRPRCRPSYFALARTKNRVL